MRCMPKSIGAFWFVCHMLEHNSKASASAEAEPQSNTSERPQSVLGADTRLETASTPEQMGAAGQSKRAVKETIT